MHKNKGEPRGIDTAENGVHKPVACKYNDDCDRKLTTTVEMTSAMKTLKCGLDGIERLL